MASTSKGHYAVYTYTLCDNADHIVHSFSCTSGLDIVKKSELGPTSYSFCFAGYDCQCPTVCFALEPFPFSVVCCIMFNQRTKRPLFNLSTLVHNEKWFNLTGSCGTGYWSVCVCVGMSPSTLSDTWQHALSILKRSKSQHMTWETYTVTYTQTRLNLKIQCLALQ
jgi:hypothetical protein